LSHRRAQAIERKRGKKLVARPVCCCDVPDADDKKQGANEFLHTPNIIHLPLAGYNTSGKKDDGISLG